MRSCAFDDCRSPLADDARFCPRCGRPTDYPPTIRPKRFRYGGQLLGIILLSLLAVGVGLFFVGVPTSKHVPVATAVTPFDGPVVVLGPAIAQHFRVTGSHFQPSFDSSGVQGMVTFSLEPLPSAPKDWPHRLIRVGDPQDAGRAVATELPPPDLSGTVNITCAVLSASQRRRLDVEYIRPADSTSDATK